MREKKYDAKYKAKEGTSRFVRVSVMLDRTYYRRLKKIAQNPEAPSMSYIINKNLEKAIKIYEERFL